MAEVTETTTTGGAPVDVEAEAPGVLPVAHVRHLSTRGKRDLLPLEGLAGDAEQADPSGAEPPEPRPGSRRFGVEKPVWLEMALDVEPGNYQWFEGSLNPWRDVGRPAVRWDDVSDRIRSLLGVDPPDVDDPEPSDPKARVLAVLPHLYSLGVNRAVQELKLPERAGLRVRLFPVVGFGRPTRDADGHLRLEMIRMNVAVIDDVIFSIRLPDQLCPSRREPDAPPTPDECVVPPKLRLPTRFLPSWAGAQAFDVADEIARHQAATVRALADEVRRDMPALDEEAAEVAGADEAEAADRRPTLRSSFSREARGADVDVVRGWLVVLARVFAGWVAARARAVWRRTGAALAFAWRLVKGAVRRPVTGETAGAETADGARSEEVSDLIRYGQLTAVVDFSDRQLARLLRRFGSFGEDGPRTDADPEGADIRRRYKYALDEMRSLRGELTSARDRISARAEAHREDEFQRFQFIAAVVGSAILIPTLVAGIFGANVNFPGREDTEGLVALLLLIVAFGAGGGWLIDHIWKRDWRPPTMWRPIVGWVVALCVVAATVILVFFSEG